MAVVKVESKTYTVEPLYQWDKNQVLEIRGLSLASLPEIHFANDAMSRAIVRQSEMDGAGVITVGVPNSLLQTPYRITVYVCTYKGGTFQTLYKIEIPVKKRVRPDDYTLENDPEVYSFNALENKIQNLLISASATYNQANEQAIAAANAYNQSKNNMATAESTYNQASAKAAAAESAHNQAAAQAAAAEQRYENALETLGGVEDGGVFLKKYGGTMGGPLNMNGNGISGLPDPVGDGDAVPKRLLNFQLLWENSEAVGIEDIEIEPDKYRMYAIEYIGDFDSAGQYKYCDIMAAGTRHRLLHMTLGEGVAYAYMRDIEADENGIHIGSGTRGQIGVGKVTTASACVPTAIYGIR